MKEPELLKYVVTVPYNSFQPFDVCRIKVSYEHTIHSTSAVVKANKVKGVGGTSRK